MKDFVASLERPRKVILLVQAGAPVDATISGLLQHLEAGDMIIDGGNEWYENTERRMAMCEEKGILFMGMGVSGGEEGARRGPSMMPGGPKGESSCRKKKKKKEKRFVTTIKRKKKVPSYNYISLVARTLFSITPIWSFTRTRP